MQALVFGKEKGGRCERQASNKASYALCDRQASKGNVNDFLILRALYHTCGTTEGSTCQKYTDTRKGLHGTKSASPREC